MHHPEASGNSNPCARSNTSACWRSAPSGTRTFAIQLTIRSTASLTASDGSDSIRGANRSRNVEALPECGEETDNCLDGYPSGAVCPWSADFPRLQERGELVDLPFEDLVDVLLRRAHALDKAATGDGMHTRSANN